MSAAGSKMYRYRSEGEEHGPVDAQQLMDLFATHMITAFDEVQVDGESQWIAAQTVVGGLLESKAGATTAKPGPTSASASATASTSARGSASTPQGQQAARPSAQPLVIPQRGAPAPKPEGTISDAEIAASIAYARRQVERTRRFRLALLGGVFVAIVGGAFRYSTNLRAVTPAPGSAFHTETRITLDAAQATLSGAGTSGSGTGTYTLSRVRDVTYVGDGTVNAAVYDEPIRWQADFTDAPDYSEVKRSVLGGRVINFAGSVPTLSGSAPASMSPLKLVSVAFDNSALYPDERMWPWPWKSWVVASPQACSVFALDVESCEAELTLKFVGFASCNGDRCARLSFAGTWDGVTEGDKVKITLTGEIIRSLSQGVDLSVRATGTMTIERVVPGGTSPATAKLSGPVTYAQSTERAP